MRHYDFKIGQRVGYKHNDFTGTVKHIHNNEINALRSVVISWDDMQGEVAEHFDDELKNIYEIKFEPATK